MAYTQFSHSLCMEVTLQDALKAQCSLLSRRKAVERLCITSYEMTVHVILSYPPWETTLHSFGDVCYLYTAVLVSPVHSPVQSPAFTESHCIGDCQSIEKSTIDYKIGDRLENRQSIIKSANDCEIDFQRSEIAYKIDNRL